MLKELRALNVDGVDLQWPSELDELNGIEVASLLALHGEATKRLQEAMQTQALVTRTNRKRTWYAVLFVLGAMLLGATAAWATRPRFLLDVPKSELPAVTRMDTAQLQYMLAETMPPSEANWKAVADNFGSDPKSSWWVYRSKEELAKLYVVRGENKLAAALFEELARATDVDSTNENQFRAFGLAGLAFTAHRAGNKEEVNKKLDELFGIVGGVSPNQLAAVLKDWQMEQLVEAVVRENRRADYDKFGQEWKDVLMGLPEGPTNAAP
jgi:hypothetical protein